MRPKAGDTLVRYTHAGGMGLLNNGGLDRMKLTEDEESELVDVMDFGLSQPHQGVEGSFFFTLDGEREHARMLELLSKASIRGVVRAEYTLLGEPNWVSDDGQVAVDPSLIEANGSRAVKSYKRFLAKRDVDAEKDMPFDVAAAGNVDMDEAQAVLDWWVESGGAAHGGTWGQANPAGEYEADRYRYVLESVTEEEEHDDYRRDGLKYRVYRFNIHMDGGTQDPDTGDILFDAPGDAVRDIPYRSGVVWRGMSHGEYEAMMASGVIQSHNAVSHHVTPGEYGDVGYAPGDLTYFTDNPSYAMEYAGGELTSMMAAPSPTRPGYIVGVRAQEPGPMPEVDEDEEDLYGEFEHRGDPAWREAGEQGAVLVPPLSTSEIVEVYRVTPERVSIGDGTPGWFVVKVWTPLEEDRWPDEELGEDFLYEEDGEKKFVAHGAGFPVMSASKPRMKFALEKLEGGSWITKSRKRVTKSSGILDNPRVSAMLHAIVAFGPMGLDGEEEFESAQELMDAGLVIESGGQYSATPAGKAFSEGDEADEAERRIYARIAEQSGGSLIGTELTDGMGKYGVILKDPSPPFKHRISWFDRGGFYGHLVAEDEEDALRLAIRDGFTELAPGAMEAAFQPVSAGSVLSWASPGKKITMGTTVYTVAGRDGASVLVTDGVNDYEVRQGSERELAAFWPVGGSAPVMEGPIRRGVVKGLRAGIAKSDDIAAVVWARVGRIIKGMDDVRIRSEVTGFHSGQTDGYIQAVAGERKVGYLDWTSYGGEVLVRMIEVAEDFRRQGIASRMLGRLQAEFPGDVIRESGDFATEAGRALGEAARGRLQKRVAEKDVPFDAATPLDPEHEAEAQEALDWWVGSPSLHGGTWGQRGASFGEDAVPGRYRFVLSGFTPGSPRAYEFDMLPEGGVQSPGQSTMIYETPADAQDNIDAEPGVAYRLMSFEEYSAMMARGTIQSRGSVGEHLGFNEDGRSIMGPGEYSYFARYPGDALSYARGKMTSILGHPSVERPSWLIAVKEADLGDSVRETSPSDSGFYDGNEVLVGPVSTDLIYKAWALKPAVAEVGYVALNVFDEAHPGRPSITVNGEERRVEYVRSEYPKIGFIMTRVK